VELPSVVGKKKPRRAKRLARRVSGGKTRGVDGSETTHRRPVPLWQRLVIGGNVRWTMMRLLILLALTAVAGLYFFPDGQARYRRILVDGLSMHPTFENGQSLWMHALEYSDHSPGRGDVVVLGNEGESPFYLKRIIGLPGDRIGLRRGQLTVNGDVYDTFGHGRIQARLQPMVLGTAEFFVMGDNRPISSGGVVEAGKILGKIL